MGDWLRVKLGLVLMSGAMCPPCCSSWGQTVMEVMKIMASSLTRSMRTPLHTVPPALQPPPPTMMGHGSSRAIVDGCWIIVKQESPRRTSTSALLTTPKPLTMWITTNCGKFLKRWEYQTTWPASWEICMQVKKQQLELDMEQQNGSRSGKEYIKALYCHPAYLTSIQNSSCGMLGWMKHKLESRLPGEISITSDTQMTLPLWQKVKKN